MEEMPAGDALGLGLEEMDFLQAEKEQEGIPGRDNHTSKSPKVGENTE